MHRFCRQPLPKSLLLALLLALPSACTVADVDYSGKRCSADALCPEGWACLSGACHLPAAGQQACTPRFTVKHLHRVWGTPAGIRWSWTPVGTKDEFVQYKLVLGKTDSNLESALATAKKGDNDGMGGQIWAQEDNPELGQYELRLSGNTDLVTATTTDGLEPGQEYHARLLAYDAEGCVFQSDVAIGSTGLPSSLDATFFDEAPHPQGYPRPAGDSGTVAATIASVPGKAFEGSKYLLWPGWPTDGSVSPGTYYENVGISGLKADPAKDYPLLDFSVAYLEAAVAIDGPPLAAWGEVRLLLGPAPGDCSATSELWEVKPYVLRPGGNYQLIQIPLDHFELGGKTLDAATLASRSICEVSFGRTWALGEPVRVDSIRVRW